MTTESARVPTEPRQGWSVDTALDHVLSLLSANDKRYEQRFEASQKALDAALTAQKEATTSAFAAQEKAINAALASAERAVLKAELATEKRFESVNEFRGTLDQQQRTLIPRSEVDVLVKGLEEKIAQITKQQDAQIAERQGIKGGWGYAVGIVGFVLTIVSIGVLVAKALGG
jgi:hypothetical protein